MTEPVAPPLPEGVVVVVRRTDGRYLFIQRAGGKAFAGYWSPVSGQVEPGESHPETAIREAREEVGIEVRPLRQLHVGPSANRLFTLYWWLCEHVAGEACPRALDEVAEVTWISTVDLHRLQPHFEQDRAVMEKLDEALAGAS